MQVRSLESGRLQVKLVIVEHDKVCTRRRLESQPMCWNETFRVSMVGNWVGPPFLAQANSKRGQVAIVTPQAEFQSRVLAGMSVAPWLHSRPCSTSTHV
jgi:hypothetical protein